MSDAINNSTTGLIKRVSSLENQSETGIYEINRNFNKSGSTSSSSTTYAYVDIFTFTTSGNVYIHSFSILSFVWKLVVYYDTVRSCYTQPKYCVELDGNKLVESNNGHTDLYPAAKTWEDTLSYTYSPSTYTTLSAGVHTIRVGVKGYSYGDYKSISTLTLSNCPFSIKLYRDGTGSIVI